MLCNHSMPTLQAWLGRHLHVQHAVGYSGGSPRETHCLESPLDLKEQLCPKTALTRLCSLTGGPGCSKEQTLPWWLQEAAAGCPT